MNLLELATGGEPIKTDVSANVTFDQSVYTGIAFAIAGIMLIVIVFFILHKYA